MFVTATFYGLKKEVRASVPASAIVHMHDRDWVYVPVESGRFRRLEVVVGKMLVGASPAGSPGSAPSTPARGNNETQEINSGLRPGQQVVANALTLQATVEQ